MQTEQARFNMIEQQIRPWDVSDKRVLEIMGQIQREDFVPNQYKNLAFADIEVPLGDGQYMMFPRVEARLLQALDIQSNESVLEIGTGSGFVTACIAALGGQVTSIDLNIEFTEQAQSRLNDLKISNVELLSGDGLIDPIGTGTYDVIAVTGSMNEVTDTLKNQLNIAGRLFVITGQAPVMQAKLVTRIDNDTWSTDILFETEHVSLKMTEKTQHFIF